MHNIISIKLYLAIFFMLCFGQLFSQSYFVENKGQYSKEVIAKKNIIGGALFIEKGKFFKDLTICIDTLKVFYELIEY